MQQHVVRRHFYPKIVGFKGGLGAYFVDGSVQNEEEIIEEGKVYKAAEFGDEWQDTISTRRRQRRKVNHVYGKVRSEGQDL